jgi:DNA mismatch endonuclease (patch repair protein)
MPKSNRGFWRAKLARNASRDAEELAAIRKQGWRTLVVWECEIKNERRLVARLRRFLQ